MVTPIVVPANPIVLNVHNEFTHLNEWISGSCDRSSSKAPKKIINSCNVKVPSL